MASDTHQPSEPRHYQPLIHDALALYNLRDYRLEFIRHNENLVYRVVAGSTGQTYLLRVHLPAREGFRGLQQDPKAIESELAWLRALRSDTDIVLQEPQPNTAGSHVTLLEFPGEEKPVPCTLLTWLEGDQFKQTEPDADELAIRFGALQRVLHDHARTWSPLGVLRRPRYDAPVLERAMAGLSGAVQRGRINAEDYQHVARASEKVLSLFDTIKPVGEVWGLVHADLPGNLIVTGGNLVPIDFSLSGFSYYYLDLGISLCNLKHHLRRPFLAGYGTELSEEAQRRTEAFIIMMILVAASRQVNNPAWSQWFERRFPLIAGDYCQRLLKGEGFLFDI